MSLKSTQPSVAVVLALFAHRDDGAAFDVHGDRGVVDVRQSDAGSSTADGLEGEEIAELIVEQVQSPAGEALDNYKTDQ